MKSDIYKDAIICFYFSSNQQKAEFLVYGNKRGFQYFIDECMKFKNELWEEYKEHYHLRDKNSPRIYDGKKMKSQSLTLWPSSEQNISIKLVGWSHAPDIECSQNGIDDLCQKIKNYIEEESNDRPLVLEVPAGLHSRKGQGLPKKGFLQFVLKS